MGTFFMKKGGCLGFNMSGRVEVEAVESLSRQQGSVATLREEGQTSRSLRELLGAGWADVSLSKPTPWLVVTASGLGTTRQSAREVGKLAELHSGGHPAIVDQRLVQQHTGARQEVAPVAGDLSRDSEV